MSSLTPAQRVQEALAFTQRRPLRFLSQSFLIDPNILERIVDAAGIVPGSLVLEVGPGPGTLTATLLDRGALVLGIELDRDLAVYLRKTFANAPLDLIEGDALAVDIEAAMGPRGPWIVVANLPYAITSPMLRRLNDLAPRLQRAVVTVQREVAERICAPEGSPHRGALSAFVQWRYKPEILRIVSPRAFQPPPKVDSAVAKLEPLGEHAHPAPKSAYDRLVRAAFGQRRKTLRRALALGPNALPREHLGDILAVAGLSGSERAEEVSVAQFAQMANHLATLMEEDP